jgi:hypothetical protein
MTPERYRECLDLLGLTQRGLSRVLRCSDRLTREWATGVSGVPREVAVWLEASVVLRKDKPKARLKWLKSSTEWRRNPVVWITHGGQKMPLKRACEVAGIARASVYYRVKEFGLSPQAAFNMVKKSHVERATSLT